ncbi:Aste57867_11105 [Aphanomyces stellatus]|uniref:Aste57867_11105 protein n=1 Tax=Aphanomyces stellatus TaxID=120398 RepID=A0A485KS02_9STRA|nr:hypothetical protein As57867_011063 [Aphanomyces stellatus]VFT87972.1 Aste57867_11105 [Aphanomyces stellatus]
MPNQHHDHSPYALKPHTASTQADDDVDESQPLIATDLELSHLAADWKAFWGILTGSQLHWLLVLAPLAVYVTLAKWDATYVFTLNFLALLPLANILGEATEDLLSHMGHTVGSLVNASFGNAMEILIAIFALRNGEVDLVQSSLIGSMLSNLLLVLGMCFVSGQLGGAHESSFNLTGASINMSLLFVASFAMLIPSYYISMGGKFDDGQAVGDDRKASVLRLSRLTAVFLVLMYVQHLVFKLVTHRRVCAAVTRLNTHPHETYMSLPGAMALLLATTACVACLSEFLVSSVDALTQSSGIPKSFLGIIVLPIVGNTVQHVEHFSALQGAFKNKMDLAMGVAVGSATQIMLFVAPVCVLAGWVMDTPMTLAFNEFEAMTYIMSTILVYIIVADGKSNWIEGSMLLTLYVLIALSLLEIDI